MVFLECTCSHNDCNNDNNLIKMNLKSLAFWKTLTPANLQWLPQLYFLEWSVTALTVILDYLKVTQNRTTTITFRKDIVKFLQPLNGIAFFDGYLESDEGVLRAVHRVVLSLHSDYFKKEFSKKDSIMLSASTHMLDLLLKLLYSGKVAVNDRERVKLVEVLGKYNIENWHESDGTSDDEASDDESSFTPDLASTNNDAVPQESGPESGDGETSAGDKTDSPGPTSALSILEALVEITRDPEWLKGKPYSLRYWVAVILRRNSGKINGTQLTKKFDADPSVCKTYGSIDPITSNFKVSLRGCPPTTAEDIIEYLSRPGVVPTPIDKSTYSLRFWVVAMILRLKNLDRKVDPVLKMTEINGSKLNRAGSSATPASENFDAVEDKRRKH